MASSVPKGLQEQRDFIQDLESDQFGWDIMIGDAFVRGMRDIGYKSTAFALAELIDNSIQAGAKKVDVIFGFRGKKPAQVAIVDDGHGMDPQMARASLVWGAGTRADSPEGFGKYGYGLPSASISQCFRATVYSKTDSGEWHRAYLDVDEIREGSWTQGNRIEMPATKPTEPPAFVVDALESSGRWETFSHGTVVVWDRLDENRIERKSREGLRDSLVTNLGLIYRKYLLATTLTVDGVVVEPVDPLFLNEGFRYYDLDEDRAIELPPARIDVKDKETGEELGAMTVRFARMPATFFRKPEFKRSNRPSKSSMNARLEIADANNGVIFLRNGRQIDVRRPPRSLGRINSTTDRFWAVEVDFEAGLDDLFSISTSKQQVTPDERIWHMLADKGNLFKAIAEMRNAYKKEALQVATEAEQAKNSIRASVEAVEAAERYRTTPPPEPTPEREEEAQDNLSREATKRAGKAGLDAKDVERDLIARREGSTRLVEPEDMPGAPFFRCVQEGGTRVMYLNTAHPFYSQLYQGPTASPRLRAGLEVLLWALANAELDAHPGTERRQFYERERASVWSPELADSLQELDKISLVEEEEEAAA
jgi:hypothetical protein